MGCKHFPFKFEGCDLVRIFGSVRFWDPVVWKSSFRSWSFFWVEDAGFWRGWSWTLARWWRGWAVVFLGVGRSVMVFLRFPKAFKRRGQMIIYLDSFRWLGQQGFGRCFSQNFELLVSSRFWGQKEPHFSHTPTFQNKRETPMACAYLRHLSILDHVSKRKKHPRTTVFGSFCLLPKPGPAYDPKPRTEKLSLRTSSLSRPGGRSVARLGELRAELRGAKRRAHRRRVQLSAFALGLVDKNG